MVVMDARTQQVLVDQPFSKVREVGQDVRKVIRPTDENHSGRPEEI